MTSTSIPLPEGVEFKTVTIQGLSDETFAGKLAFKIWPESAVKKRAFKKTFKIVGTIFGCSLIGLFVHVLLIVIIPTLLITTIATIPLYMKNLAEKETFFYVEGSCPSCHKNGQLRPYINSRLQSKITVQCPECGEAANVQISS